MALKHVTEVCLIKLDIHIFGQSKKCLMSQSFHEQNTKTTIVGISNIENKE